MTVFEMLKPMSRPILKCEVRTDEGSELSEVKRGRR
jgi:hypothetical protein